jgi:acyl-CoA synthetase (AMP-forming)/AMP-acid ligase II
VNTREEVQATLTAPGQIFEITEETVGGLSLRVWKHAPTSLRTIVELSRLHAEKVFLVYEDERTTFEEHFRQVATMAQRLVDDYGVVKGDRVAIAMRNFPEWPVAFFAAAAAGAVVVPLNAWWTGAELEYGLADSGSKVLFADAERVERMTDHFAQLDLAGVIVARAEGELAPGHAHFADVLAAVAGDVSLPDVELAPDDDATIFYTSGTTGRPKGALGTQRNICSSVLGLA